MHYPRSLSDSIWHCHSFVDACDNLLLPYFRQNGNSERKSAKEPKFVGKIRVFHSFPTKKRHVKSDTQHCFDPQNGPPVFIRNLWKRHHQSWSHFHAGFLRCLKLNLQTVSCEVSCFQGEPVVKSANWFYQRFSRFSHVFPRLFECSDFLLHQDFYPWFCLTSKHQSYQASFRKWHSRTCFGFFTGIFLMDPHGMVSDRPGWKRSGRLESTLACSQLGASRMTIESIENSTKKKRCSIQLSYLENLIETGPKITQTRKNLQLSWNTMAVDVKDVGEIQQKHENKCLPASNLIVNAYCCSSCRA